jgi:hypothetical protein
MVYVDHIDANKEGNQFVDSLIENQVDTIFSFYIKCSSCLPGSSKPNWVYWQHNGQYKIVKFTSYMRYLPKSIRLESEFAFADSLLPSIQLEKFDKEFSLISHSCDETVRIVSGKQEITYSITHEAQERHQAAASVLVLDKFKATLYYINQQYWPGYDSKLEKRKPVKKSK